ncbi:FabD/lysophospholipase-like protein [Cucurbitaria berberidis CBS 394.84]|uniref:FabD/lysophospholipase-like protein n=1 Tax=Cucurbitaria berberidis CBS 394.84 TaxID=1168544 RepID=A0A9P4GPR4_9PLEO|nr:FabD/lysophospholipase-like protein [Cucurbitaria berberidis CBS 394.84]KAF1849072.1 FabD/lysophospholipase-like protein [Cucurbitaria berberidis CBS 394.84]
MLVSDFLTYFAIDGGGIRGYSSLLILKEIMKVIEDLEKQDDVAVDSSFHPETYVAPHNKRKNPSPGGESCRYLPCHYFDYVGGTSTGGLIAIMLGRLRMGIDQCLEEYESFGGEIFGHPRWFSIRGPLPSFKEKYNGKRLQRAVENVVENRSSPEQKAVGAGYFGSARELCKTYNIPIWQVARATTAAPTYFDPVPIQNNTFGDGGLGSNNPVQEIFWEVATMHGNNASVINLVVSIGTGQADSVKLHPSGPKKVISYFTATKALATESEQKHAAMGALIETTESSDAVHYQRFNLSSEQGLKNMKLDEWKIEGKRRLTKHGFKRREESTLDKIKRLTQNYCASDEVQEDIRKVARKLVDHRRARCSDQRKWELWATGIRYRCTVKRCDKAQKLRPSKADLKYHIEKIHPNSFRGKTDIEKRCVLEELIRKGTCPY